MIHNEKVIKKLLHSKHLLFASGLIFTAFSVSGTELKNGDRIALLGNTFIEREGTTGYIETALLLSHPELDLTFRNFGWSGDTVKGASGVTLSPKKVTA